MSLLAETELIALEGRYLNSAEWNQWVAPQWRGKNRLEWESVLHKQDSQEWRLRAKRLQLGIQTPLAEFIAGRIRNSLGSSRVFIPPFDRLDELPSPVSSEGERPASDTAALQTSWGPAHLRAGYLWAKENARYRSFAHAQVLAAPGWEASAMAGRLEPKTNSAGAALQHSTDWGEWRWESTTSRQEKEEFYLAFTPLPSLEKRLVKRSFLRHLALWEKAFPADWVASLEYYYNGKGAKRKENYDITQILQGEDLQMAQRYWGASISKILSPLWSAGLKSAYNQEDQSASLLPRLSFKAADGRFSAEALGGWNQGRKTSEYGILPDRFQLNAAFFF